MKPQSIATATLLSAAVLFCSTTFTFARHGGGGGGNGSGYSGHAGSSGARASAGYSGSSGMRSYNGARAYSSMRYNGRVYTGRVTGNYSSRNLANRTSHISNVHRATTTQHLNSARRASNQVHHGQSNVNRNHRTASVNRTRERSTGASSANASEQRKKGGSDNGLSTLRQTHRRANDQNLAKNNPKNRNRFNQATQNELRHWNGRRSDVNEARNRNQQARHNHHNKDWWRHHCHTIIFVDYGWWGWWDGWWYPCWGYDPYSVYGYAEPIYGYDGLAPDEAVANVQSELQRLGYYTYSVDGVMGPATQQAIMRYQQDRGLPITGAIDPATIGSLGVT